MMHVGLGRAHPLHIEYVHLGICLAFIQDVMMEAILSHPRLNLQRKIALVKALGKVIWIQNDLMAKWHVKDGAEFKTEDEEVMVEEEGYLHGRKILDGIDEGIEGENGSPASPSRLPRPSSSGTPAGTCPFSGISTGMGELRIDGDVTPKAPETPKRESAETVS